MSKDTFFFPHDHNARGDEKIINLVRTMSWEGYGLYWALIEKLYESGGRIVSDFDAIAYDLHTDAGKVKSVATKFDLFFFVGSPRCLASKSVDRRLQERRVRVAQAKVAAGARWGDMREQCGSNAGAMRPHEISNAINKEIKKERKKEITTAKGAPSAVAFKQEVVDWTEVRLPKGLHQDYPGVLVVNIPANDCAWILEKYPNLGSRVAGALQERVEQKKAEAKHE